MLKRLAAILALALVAVATLTLPGVANNTANNKGDAWLTNSPETETGHAHVPHLDCGTIYLHGSALDESGTFDIASIPGTGSGKTIWSGLAWSAPGSGDVLATFSGSALVAAAVAQDSAVANPNQGYHFKLTLHQSGGDKSKVFWVRCTEEPPTPTLGVTKTADASPVVSGNPIGFTITVAPNSGSYANNVHLNDPLPTGDGVNWSISPPYTGPGTCSIGGSPQTLTCSFGDLGASDHDASASVHVTSATVAGTTAALEAATLTNTATATADSVDPVGSTARVVVDPASPDLGIVKTADHDSVLAGSQIGFTVTVTNAGPGVAKAVSVHDPLPSSGGGSWSISPAYSGPGSCSIGGLPRTLSCWLGNLAASASASVHMVATTSALSAVRLTNVATASAGNDDPVTATARTSTTVPVVPPVVPPSPNLGITKTADAASVTAGSLVGFTVSVGNQGQGSALGASLNDPLPAAGGASWSISPTYAGAGTCSITGSAPSQTLGCSFGTMGSGVTATVHVVATSPATAISLTNVATASADNNPAVSATAHTATTVSNRPAAPGLTITKTADAVTATAGGKVGFTIAVANQGPGVATGASLNDPLPNTGAGTWAISPAYSGQGSCSIAGSSQPQTLACSFGTLAAGAGASVHVIASTPTGTAVTLTNVATALSDNGPPVTAGAHVDVEVAPAVEVAPLTLSQTPSPSPTASPSPAPSPSVLGERVTRNPTSLPLTGGVPVILVYPALFLLVTGAVLVALSRRSTQAASRAAST